MPFVPAKLTADLTAAFDSPGSEEADMAALIAAAISEYFAGVVLPAPASALKSGMKAAAETPLLGMSSDGAFPGKFVEAVMAASALITSAGDANTPVAETEPDISGAFVSSNTSGATAAAITTAVDLATGAWTQIIPPATAPVPWS